MKIVMFTPGNRVSAIGRSAALTVRALLAQGHEVVVVRTEQTLFLEQDIHDFGEADHLIWTDEQVISTLISEQVDIFVYQLGNHFPFHEGAVYWLSRLPGIVCLHDFFLGHLFLGWAQGRRAEAQSVLENWYGQSATEFFSAESGVDFIRKTQDCCPMVEWICSMATGVITHSHWGVGRVLTSCPGPVRTVPLPYDVLSTDNAPVMTRSEEDQFNVLTIGHVNPNKRVESVIRAIGESELLRKNTTYRLVGSITPEVRSDLTSQAEKQGVRLVIDGEVDDASLTQAILDADVVSCLRWPSLEAASASAIEAMLYGKPTVVTDVGFYSEIPDSCVKKVNPDYELGDLKVALESLCLDRGLRKDLGDSAKKWARQTFTADGYAQVIASIALDSKKAEPVLHAMNYFFGMLQRWKAGSSLLELEDIWTHLEVFDCKRKG